jgi:hypothetical protein
MEESCLPEPSEFWHPLHLCNDAQRVHLPGPGGWIHNYIAHLCLPPILLHAAGGHVLTEPRMESEVCRTF